MIAIRNNFFETNSSSVHVLVIPKDTNIHIPTKIYLHRGKYGWETDDVIDTIDYFYQACVDRGQEEVMKFIEYLKRKGVEEIHYKELDYSHEENTWQTSGWIDHSNEIPLDEFFNNESLLDRFLFGEGSFVRTGNDNGRDECPDENDFDSSIYDTIEKGN